MLTNHPIENYLIHTYQQSHIPTVNTIAETYGEILFLSFAKLIQKIHWDPQDIFIDFGSGLGKLCLHIFLTQTIKKVVGVEINPHLYQQSMTALDKVKNDFPDLFAHQSMEFHHQDFLTFNFQEATIALIASPCYTQSVLNQLGELINQSNLKTVLTLKPIATLERLKFKKIHPLECSWDAALCYHYA